MIPDSCELQGTVRTFTPEVLDLIERRMKHVAEYTCAAFGVNCEFEFMRKYPSTINSAREAALARQYNPSYDFNDELIPLGASYWVRLAEAWLAQDARSVPDLLAQTTN